MDESGRPVRLIHWFAMVCASSIAGALFGRCIGTLLAALSGDYVVMASEYVWLGFRTGLFAGTAVAAWHTITRQPRWGANALLRAGSVAGLAAISAIGLMAGSALLLSLVVGVLPEGANLAHLRRYVVFLAIHHLWPYAVIIGIMVGCLGPWRRRPA